MNAPVEYVLTVICDGITESHDAVPLRRFGYRTKPANSLGFLPWVELLSDFDQGEPVLQTPFGEARRLAKLDPSRSRRDLPPMTYATRYRFDCPTCGTIPVRGERAEQAFDQVRHADAAPFLPLRLIAG